MIKIFAFNSLYHEIGKKKRNLSDNMKYKKKN